MAVRGKSAGSSDIRMIQSLREFLHFMQQRAEWLQCNPHLCFQEAANLPAQLQPAVAADEMWHDVVERASKWEQNAIFFTGAATKSSLRGINKGSGDKDIKGNAAGDLAQQGARKNQQEKGVEEDKNNSGDDFDDDDTSSMASNDSVGRSKFGSDGQGSDAERRQDTDSAEDLSSFKVASTVSLSSGFKRWVRWVNKPMSEDPCIAVMSGHRGPVNCIGWARTMEQGHDPLYASASDDTTVRVWSTVGDCVTTLVGHSDAVNVCDFCPTDPTILASGDSAGVLVFWDVALGASKWQMDLSTGNMQEEEEGEQEKEKEEGQHSTGRESGAALRNRDSESREAAVDAAGDSESEDDAEEGEAELHGRTIDNSEGANPHCISALAWAPSGNVVAVGFHNGDVAMITVSFTYENGERHGESTLHARWNAHSGSVSSIRFGQCGGRGWGLHIQRVKEGLNISNMACFKPDRIVAQGWYTSCNIFLPNSKRA